MGYLMQYFDNYGVFYSRWNPYEKTKYIVSKGIKSKNSKLFEETYIKNSPLRL